jgi:F-type H+-transporting ATPase subunit a
MIIGAEKEQASTVMDQVGPYIIGHVSNSDQSHPIFHLPSVFGIDMSVTKHVLMLWIVAFVVSLFVIIPIRRYVRQSSYNPSKASSAIEAIAQFIRDSIVSPNVGSKWVNTWTPLVLTFFFFILFANGIGMIPIFDLLGVINKFVHSSFIDSLLHGGATATGNFHVTAALASITFFAIIIAGTKAHGFINHWKNLVPHGLAWPVYIILIPIELMGMIVKPFALTMRLAANMTGGHIAILALLSLMAIFAEIFQSTVAGIGVALISVPMAAAISGLEIIVVLVQAYVFTLLTAVFIGMAINVQH